VESDSIFETSGGETFESRPIGEYLRRQRILRGMSAEELADLTRIPLRSLERLESGQFDGENDGFVRGFVRTVAVALGLDTEDTISRMLQEPQASAWERHGPGRSAKQLFATIVFLLLLGCLFLGFRAAWSLLLGDASRPASREVVIWRDPVHALADATGENLGPIEEIGPRSAEFIVGSDPGSAPGVRASGESVAMESMRAREGLAAAQGEGDEVVPAP